MKKENRKNIFKYFIKLAACCGQFFLYAYQTCAFATLANCLENPKLPRNQCLKDWSVLIYMAADNDLSPYALWDIYEMEKKFPGENFGASGPYSDVIVELDTAGNKGVSLYHIEQDNKLYDTQLDIDYFKNADESEITSPRLAHYSEDIPSTAENSLNHFLQFSFKNYPSKQIMLVIWGHGEGFISHYHNGNLANLSDDSKLLENSPLFTKEMIAAKKLNFNQLNSLFPIDKVFGGVAFDDTDLSYLDIPTLNNILKENSEEFLEGRPLDILAFDACLMQSYEVAKSLQDRALFLLGSNQIQNYMGLPYHLLLNSLNKKNPQAFDFAKEIPTLVKEANNIIPLNNRFNAAVSSTFTASTLSLHELHYQLTPSLEKLRLGIRLYIDERPMREIDLQFILENSPNFRGETRDIGLFIGALKKMIYEEKIKEGESEGASLLEALCNQTLDALNRTILASTFGSLYVDPKEAQLGKKNSYLLGLFKGISIWLPSRVEFYQHRKNEFKDFPLLFKPRVWD